VPPPLTGLASAPSVKALLTRQCLTGSKPVIQASNAAAAQPEGSELNSRAVVPPKALARTVKQARRVQRGGSMSDGVRVDRLVRIHLTQRQMVLYYKPGYMLSLYPRPVLELTEGVARLFEPIPVPVHEEVVRDSIPLLLFRRLRCV
jgi:hypothetical protein